MFKYVHHSAYVVSDMEDAMHTFRDLFELQVDDHRVIEGETSVEMVTFRCGPTLIEILRPIHHPALSKFLEEHGPGLHHVAYAMEDLSNHIEKLNQKGVFTSEIFKAGTDWNIAYFDLEKSHLEILKSSGHGDHLVQA